MSSRYLLCTDLDRTLLPNGAQPESEMARRYFAALAARPELTLAYVSGRSLALVQAAIVDYALPEPDFIVGDVGTSIYRAQGEHWQRWRDWDAEIAQDWRGRKRAELADMLAGIHQLQPQEAHKQGEFKLSYYVSLSEDEESLLRSVQGVLEQQNVAASLVWSVDEPVGVGLLDVLPAAATKRHAVEFLMQAQSFDLDSTVFAGDSGNDLPVLISPIRSVLVANASDEVKRKALDAVALNGLTHALYIARGGLLGMNGHYAAGILEGFLHYLPEAEQWFREALQ